MQIWFGGVWQQLNYHISGREKIRETRNDLKICHFKKGNRGSKAKYLNKSVIRLKIQLMSCYRILKQLLSLF